jgi:hypothetical protein
VARDGRRFSATLIVGALAERSSASVGLLLAWVVTRLVMLGLIVLLLVRGRGNPAAPMLAIGLTILFADFGSTWLPRSTWTPLNLLVWIPVTCAGAYCQLRFASAISGGIDDRRQLWVARVVGIATGAAVALFEIVYGAIIPVGSLVPPFWFLLGGTILTNVTMYGLMLRNYPSCPEQTRNRIKVVLSAFVCILLGMVIINVALLLMGASPLAAALTSMPVALLGLGLLTYAVLGQRLFDFGFAVNRTLVYGTISFILLASFGLAEWGVDHLIPEAWHKESALYSAGIALALFLSFHRLRDWVEHQVERFFFHKWQLNEAALRRFVGSGGHFAQSPVLCRAFAEEVSRFAGGAQAALYLRDAAGGYGMGAGSLAEAAPAYAEDDPAFALMRAERRPIELAQARGGLPGVLAFPMLDQGKLLGFVLLDRKPGDADYRPDEVELLGWATHQVGLDLQAIRARDLETAVAELVATNLAITADRDRLSLILQNLRPRRNLA